MQIEGKNAVRELLTSKYTIEKLSVLDGTKDVDIRGIIKTAKDAGIKVEFISKAILDAKSVTKHHQGIIAEATEFVYSNLDEIINEAKSKNEDLLFLLLDGLSDPHNLGSIMRVAECAGVTAIIIPKNRSVLVNETVVRVSAGASEHVKVVKVTNLNNCIKELKKRGVFVYGADMDGNLMYNANLTGDIAIVIGSEGFGISSLTKKECDEIVAIPMFGKVNSLNASVSAGIVVYEAIRQRRK